MTETFEQAVLPHLGAGRRLARWLVRNEHDAEDVLQEASLRAFRYFKTFSGGNARAWFLRIVRNSCNGWHDPRWLEATDQFDEQAHSIDESRSNPETLLLKNDHAVLITRALNMLPARFREPLMLRELEGLSYRELADVLEVPIGTVMSTLSRGRSALRRAVDDLLKELGDSPADYL